MPCLGSRNAKYINIRSGAIECRNRIWRTAACSATSQLSARRKTAHQSFVISLLQSRRFACAMPRIAQRKSINIRSGRYRVQKSYLAHRCVQRDVSAFARRKTAHQSFVISLLQSRRFACAMPRIAQRKSINIRRRALSSAEIVFGAPLRAAQRLSFPLEGKPHIKAL